MKRITLNIITGVCLMVAGQASAHSGHHSHGIRGGNETVTVISQPARSLVDAAISVPEIGLFVNVLPGVHRVEVVDNHRYYVANNHYYRKQGNRYVVVESPDKNVKKAKRYKRTQHGYQSNKKVIVVREGH
ncbi:NAD(FAD)-dependent dehydrogenase [Alteromonas sp. BL110]|uniref:NAD(FAD)-dependent dehydrogenase n=1 Tax=Alteromonas sp. BL110 TaxID=1714845 RepID=UPI000E4FD8C1|nr:NAD(FAD)-dependent dehydrogenase [Alteromonas sp. BL110]AXT38150.1 NAD(FAD)-dependent dehydrogenase [Alteromonas sp. BL110]RKM80894.1 NAD(FAD)-dependent dehydrogenase [Alteromonas sp. BL110]